MIFEFKPIFVAKLWASSYLSSYYNLTKSHIGEVIGFSPLDLNCHSILFNQKSISLEDFFLLSSRNVSKEEILKFPVIKLIGSSQFLSIQNHPNNDLFFKRLNLKSKSEMWYFIETEKYSKIIYGSKFISESHLTNANIQSSNISEYFNYYEPLKNQKLFIPAGLVHALGADMLVLEVSEPSQTTFRIYDFDRLENNKKRELHIEYASKAINYSSKDNIPFFDNFQYDIELIDLKEDQMITYEFNHFIICFYEIIVIDNFVFEKGSFLFLTKNAKHSFKKGRFFRVTINT